MGGDSTKLAILSRLSNLSVKFSRIKRKKGSHSKWLEVRKELEAICGSEEDEAELLMKLAERESAARKAGLADIPMPSDMTVVKKRKGP
jgi:hypothetical protein